MPKTDTPAALAALDELRSATREMRTLPFTTVSTGHITVALPLHAADEIVALCDSVLAAARRGAEDRHAAASDLRHIAHGGQCEPSTLLAHSDALLSNGTTKGHEPDVLPQGMTFHAGELGDAYVAGAKSGREHQPTDEQIERACDAYVKHAHLIRLTTTKET